MRFRPALALVLTVVFLLTALMGVWAAYDRQIGWQRFGLIAGGLVIGLAIAWAGGKRGEPTLGAIGLGCAVLAAAIGSYYMLTYNWGSESTIKFSLLQQVGLWVQAHRPALIAPRDYNPNLIAGGLTPLLPLGLAGLAWSWTRRHRPGVAIAAIALGLALAAFILSSARDAWLGLSAGALVAAYLEWRTDWATRATLRLWGDVVFSGTSLVLLAGFGAVLMWPGLEGRLDTLPLGATLIARVKLWRDARVLIGDYPFTGSGLGSTVMVYSSYVLLVHVGFIEYHVHNLPLQIAVEQGLPGLLAFLGMLGTAIWGLVKTYQQRNSTAILRWAASAALIAWLVQGIGEAGNYNSSMVLIGFVPLGFALGFAQPPRVTDRKAASPAFARPMRWLPILVGLSVIVGTLLIFPPGPRAAFRANLGTVAQTRAELSVFHWPEWPIQDAVRRSPRVNLLPAVAHYQAALALEPRNATANRRLGQIELSLGDYDAARRHLEAAYAAAPHQHTTRQLLGESYAVTGDVERAADLWRTLDTSQNQLEMRHLWYANYVATPQQANWIAKAIARSAAR